MAAGPCIKIQNKAGRIVVVPLATWENGLCKDENWHIYAPPVIAAPPAHLEIIELKKPLAPEIPQSEIPQPPVKPVKHKRKGK